MKYVSGARNRRSVRLKGYNYAQASAYFVTICTQGRECLFDDPVVNEILTDVWQTLSSRFPMLALDDFVIMPNHIHMIMWLQPSARDTAPAADVGAGRAPARNAAPATDDVGAGLAPARNAAPATDDVGSGLAPAHHAAPATLGDIVGAFKSLVFTVYLNWILTHDPRRRAKLWQRSYYEHVIRNEKELNAIRQYIRDNPHQWALDRDNPDNVRRLPPLATTAEYANEATRA